MAIGNVQFLQMTQPYVSQKQYGQSYTGGNYHQAQGMPTTTPQVVPSYKPSVEEYELAGKIANGDYNVGLNPFVNSTKPVESARGKAFEGFSVPENNGTGELSPNYRLGREDSIIGLDLNA